MTTLLPEDNIMTTALPIISAVMAGVWGFIRWILKRFDHHDERITKLERDSVGQDEFNRSVSEIYCKVENGFRHVNERLDKMYELMIQYGIGKS